MEYVIYKLFIMYNFLTYNPGTTTYFRLCLDRENEYTSMRMKFYSVYFSF